MVEDVRGGGGKPGKPAAPQYRNGKAPLPVTAPAPVARVSAGEEKRKAARDSRKRKGSLAPEGTEGTVQSAALAGGAFLTYALIGASGVGGVALLTAAALALQAAGDSDSPRASSADYGQTWKSKFWDRDAPTGAAAGKPAGETPRNNKKAVSTRLVLKAPPGASRGGVKQQSGEKKGPTLPRAGKPAAERPQNNKRAKREDDTGAAPEAEREARLAAVLDAVELPAPAGASPPNASPEEELAAAKKWLEEALAEEA